MKLIMQTTDTVLLIRPKNFLYNFQTAASNVFQTEIEKENLDQVALNEFDKLVDKLKLNGINVIVEDDTDYPIKPDAVFPNNWVTTHQDGKIIIYPMCAENRRIERRIDLLEKLKSKFKVSQLIDLSEFENQNKFLEGTGSVVFDRINKIAFACSSPRTNKELFFKLCELLNYEAIYFKAYSQNGKKIYHTNVMMSICEKFVVINLDSIKDLDEKNIVLQKLKSSKKEIINITNEQTNNFAGNLLELKRKSEKNILVLSQTAFKQFTNEQKNKMEPFVDLLPFEIPIIEKIGGGSARCMIAEIFLEPK